MTHPRHENEDTKEQILAKIEEIDIQLVSSSAQGYNALGLALDRRRLVLLVNRRFLCNIPHRRETHVRHN